MYGTISTLDWYSLLGVVGQVFILVGQFILILRKGGTNA